jgi:hypothetical protein
MILYLSDYYFAVAVILLILSTSASKGETKRLYIANKKLSISHTIKPLHFSIRELEIMQSRVILLLLLAMHILFEIIFLLYV